MVTLQIIYEADWLMSLPYLFQKQLRLEREVLIR